MHRKRNVMRSVRKGLIPITLVVCFLAGATIYGGDLAPVAGPDASGSAMFTLEDLYQRLLNGTDGSKRSGAFQEPVSNSTAGSMHSLNDIMALAPRMDTVNGATADGVLAGTNFWGLTSSPWGLQTGTMVNVGTQNITPGTTSVTITQGYHNGTGSVAGDADLISGNIKLGTNLFGVAGNLAGGVQCTGTFSSGGRWCDNGDGTVTDTKTGLIWLKDWNQFGKGNYYQRSVSASNCTTGGVATGTWRFPTVQEFRDIFTTGDEQVSIGSPRLFINIPTYDTDPDMPEPYGDLDVRFWCCGPVDQVSGFLPDCAIWNLTDNTNEYYPCSLTEDVRLPSPNTSLSTSCYAVCVMGPRHP